VVREVHLSVPLDRQYQEGVSRKKIRNQIPVPRAGAQSMDLFVNQQSKQILTGRDQKYRYQTHPGAVEPDSNRDRANYHAPSAN
jgi:hypothetical protein